MSKAVTRRKRPFGAFDQLEIAATARGRQAVPRALRHGFIAIDAARQALRAACGVTCFGRAVELRRKREKQHIFVEGRKPEQCRQPVDGGRGIGSRASGARVLIGGRSVGGILAAGLREQRVNPGEGQRDDPEIALCHGVAPHLRRLRSFFPARGMLLWPQR